MLYPFSAACNDITATAAALAVRSKLIQKQVKLVKNHEIMHRIVRVLGSSQWHAHKVKF